MNSIKTLALVPDRSRRPGAPVRRFQLHEENTPVKDRSARFAVKEKENVNVPVWAGVGAIAVGVALLFTRAKQ